MRQLVVGACSPPWRRPSSFGQRLLDCLTSDVIASLASHHFVEKRTVDRQQCCSLLRSRSVVAVQPIHHEPELQAGGERRRHSRLDCVDPNVARCDLAERLFQTIHVECVLQNFAVGLDQDRKAWELPHDLQQIE